MPVKIFRNVSKQCNLNIYNLLMKFSIFSILWMIMMKASNANEEIWETDPVSYHSNQALLASSASAPLTYLKLNDLFSISSSQAVAIDANNNYYIGAYAGLYKISNSSTTSKQLYYGDVTGVAFRSNGHVMFIDYVKSAVMVYNITTLKTSTYYTFVQTSASGIPFGLALDSSNNIYMSMDCQCSSICTCPIELLTISTMTVSAFYPKYALQNSYGIFMAPNNILYVSDSGNNRIFRININAGTAPTIYAGNNGAFHTGDGGKATSAAIYYPRGLVMDGGGNLFIAEGLGMTIRRVDTSGIITTYAGIYNASRPNGGYSGTGLRPNKSMLSYPYGLAVDNAANLVFADYGNNLVRGIYSLPPSPTATPTTAPNIFGITPADTAYGSLIALWVILGILFGMAVSIYLEYRYYREDFDKFWSCFKSQPKTSINQEHTSSPLEDEA